MMTGNNNYKRMRDDEEENRDPGPLVKVVKTNNNSKHDTSKANNRKAPPYKLKQIKSSYSDKNRHTNDEIHSSIKLCPTITTVVNTGPMQRLRDLKQLATALHVFINCGHTRFEHSLGVMELAGKKCHTIRIKQPCFGITCKDELCVRLAGLMHDIGHGPFSHAYEEFVKKYHPDYLKKHPDYKKEYETKWPALPDNWSHEMSSLTMIDAVLTHLGLAVDFDHLDEPLQQIGDGVDATSMRAFDMDDTDDNAILTSRDFVFIKECIYGEPIPEIEAVLGKGFHGRLEEKKEWLYDIVANCKSGLDVDKVDYFARDARRAFGESGKIDKVMIEEAVVAWAGCPDPTRCHKCKPNRPQHHLMICYPEKSVRSCMNFFKERFRLHSTIYHHDTIDAVQMMLSDIFCMADPYFTLPVAPLPGQPSLCRTKCEYETLPLSRAMLHPGSYLYLDDNVIKAIEISQDENLFEAKHIIGRIKNRDFYKRVGEQVIQMNKECQKKIWEDISEDEIIRGMISLNGQHTEEDGSIITLHEDDLIIQKFSMHHGMKDRDPLSQMRFLEKRQLDDAGAIDYKDLPIAKPVEQGCYDSLLPKNLMQRNLRVYSRDSSKSKCDLASHAFKQWWESAVTDMQMTSEDKTEYFPHARMCTQDSDDEDDDEYDIAPPPRDSRHTMSITPPKSDQKNYLPKYF